MYTLKHIATCLTRRHLTLAMACLIVMGTARGQMPQLQWVVQTSTHSFSFMQAMTVDGDGNTLAVIMSDGAMPFAGVQLPFVNMVSGFATGVAVVKLDPEGNVLWARSLKGPWQSSVSCRGIDTDEDNNIFVTYEAISNVSNASSIGGFTASSPRPIEYFLVKISPEGTGMWFRIANNATSVSTTASPKLTVAPDGSVYSSGVVFGSVNFQGTALINQDLSSLYLTRHHSDGHLAWAKLIRAPNNQLITPLDMVTGSDGSVYVTGPWSGESLHVDDLSIVNDNFGGSGGRYIFKIAPDGTAEWLVREHSLGTHGGTSMALTPNDELLVLSYKDEEVLLVGDIAVSGAGVVLSRYSASGEVLGASLIGGPYGNQNFWGLQISGDGNGAYYLTGTFSSPTFQFGGIEVTNAGGSTGTGEIFMVKMNALGEADWVYTLSSPDIEMSRFVEAAGADRVVVGGQYEGVELNIQGTTLLPHTAYEHEYFVASFSTTLNTRAAEALQQLIAYPNPFSENVQFDTEALQAFGNATLTVFNTSGVEVYRKQLQGNDAGQISLGHLPKGTYVARLSDGKRSLHTKLIKQ